MKMLIKAGFDLCHFAISAFLGSTSWAALFPGLSSKFTVVGGVIIMLLINAALDLLPFLLGAHLSDEIKGDYERNQKSDNSYYYPIVTSGRIVTVAIAMVLHTGSATITYLGAQIGAENVVDVNAIQAKIAEEQARIHGINSQRKQEYEAKVSSKNQGLIEKIKLAEEQHASAIKALERQAENADKRGYPGQSSRISRQIESMVRSHTAKMDKLRNEKTQVGEPQYISSSSMLTFLEKDQLRKEQQRENVTLAMKLVDIGLWIIMGLWYVLLFSVPSIAGESHVATHVVYPLFWIMKSGWNIQRDISEKSVESGNWESDALRLQSEKYEATLNELNSEKNSEIQILNAELNKLNALNENLNNLNEILNEELNSKDKILNAFRKNPDIQRADGFPESEYDHSGSLNEILNALNEILNEAELIQEDLVRNGMGRIQISIPGFGKPFTSSKIVLKMKEYLWKIQNNKGRLSTNESNIRKLFNALENARQAAIEN